MEEIYFCPNCMARITPEDGKCPECGGDINIENAPYQLPVNSILNGRYLIGKVLGAGGFGITYVSYDLKLNNKVVVKEFYMSGGVSRTSSLTVVPTDKTYEAPFSKGKERFLDEAKVLAQFIDESNIVKVRDYFEENRTAYIVMEFLDGVDLGHYAKEHGKLELDEVLTMLKPAMLALDKVHKKGLIHRDISPANLMLLKDGSVKVLDFGTARMQSVYGEKSLSVMLKPGYAPEEQYRTHGQQGSWTDVYAMSATIYRLITGKLPPVSTDRMFNDTIELPSALGVKITPEQEQALMRGLAVRATDRIQTMEELAKCLSGEQKVKKLRKPNAWKKPAAAVLALAVLGGGAYALSNRNADTAADMVLPAETEAPAAAADTADDESERAGRYVLGDEYLCVKEVQTDSDGNVRTVYERDYDDYGYFTHQKCMSYYENGEESYSYEYKYEHTYYDDIRTAELTYQVYRNNYNNNEWSDWDESYYEYEYDKNGDVIKRSEYDSEHNLKGWDEYETIDGGEYTYSYYPDGGLEGYAKSWDDKEANISYYESYDAHGNMLYHNEYEDKYDEAAQTRTYIWRCFDNGELGFEEICVYDADDKLIDGKRTVYNNYSGGEATVYTITEEYELRQVYSWEYLDEE